MEIEGRIFTINKLNEKYSQIILKKQSSGKPRLWAFEVQNTKIDPLKLNKKDKIAAKFTFDARLYKNKYYNSFYIFDIQKVEAKAKGSFDPEEKAKSNDLFNGLEEIHIIDEDTGEILL